MSNPPAREPSPGVRTYTIPATMRMMGPAKPRKHDVTDVLPTDPDPVQQHEAMHAALQEADKDKNRKLAAITEDMTRQTAWMERVNGTLDEHTARLTALEAYPPGADSLRLRLTSRKFLLSVATAAGAILAAVGGALPPEWAAVIAAISTAVFTLAEGLGDARARAAPPGSNLVNVKQQ